MTIQHADAGRQFLAEMQRRDLELNPGKDLIADGKWHRCTATNKPNGKNDGSYQLHIDGAVPFGLYRNWADGKETDYWRGEPGRALTDAEREDLERHERQARIDAEKLAAEKAKQAAERAKRRWSFARPATVHLYLKAKKVKSHELRVDEEGRLLVPILSPDDGEIVSLQLIAKDGAKWFLKGGRTKGCCFVIPGSSNAALLIVAEGYADVATVHEALGCTGVVAFSAGNLAAIANVARRFLNNHETPENEILRWRNETAAQEGLRPAEQHRRYLDTKLIIAADDDWKTKNNPGIMSALAAARTAHALVAVPDFGDDRADGDTDFNDLKRKSGLDAVKQAINAAVAPQVLFETRLLADPHSAHSEANVAELAVWKRQDAVFYEKLLEALKQKKVRARVLDSAVKEAIKKANAIAAAANARNQPAEVDIEALATSAQEIIDSEDVLSMFATDFNRLYVGETNNAKLLYLICTTRLFSKKKTMHAAVKGPSAIGKSELLSTVSEFMPPESVFKFTALSEKALLYREGDYKHMILIMAEAQDEAQQAFQNLLLRELMSEGVLNYPVSMKVDGEIRTVTIVKEGPVAFLVSTTKNRLHSENETRMLSMELDDSIDQTKAVMAKVAEREGLNQGEDRINFKQWHDFQRWVAAGEVRVFIPFAKDLAKLIPPRTVRQRRDFGQLMRAIKAHAVLHRQHRKRSNKGSIMATISNDYRAIRNLMGDLLDVTAEVKMKTKMPETIAAVKRVQPNDDEKGASVSDIARELNLDKSSTRRRLYIAMYDGFVENLESRKGRPAQYRVVTAARPDRTIETILPTVADLKRAGIERRNATTPVNLTARMHARRSNR